MVFSTIKKEKNTLADLRVSSRWSNWYLIALKIAMGLLLVLLVALFWVLFESEKEEQRTTLIADVLWLEQSINFHLEGNAEVFEQMSGELSPDRRDRSLFRQRAQYLLRNNPDIHQILWLEASGRVVDADPAVNLPRLGVENIGGERHLLAMEMSRKLGKPMYTDAYSTPAGWQFEMYVPVFVDGKYDGSLVAVYSFNSMLKHMVPWWFAEKYQVRIINEDGSLLASKTRTGSATAAINYAIPVEPPGYGIVLRVDAYHSAGSFVEIVLTTLVIALAVAVLASLWVMRGHIQRRLAAEQAYRAEYAFRKAMEDSLTVGMRARDRAGRITYVNPAFCQMVGFDEDELIGVSPPMPFWSPEEQEKSQAINESVIAGHAPREGAEVRLMRKDGKRFDALIYEAPLIDADGQHTGWMASIVDVTARKRAEELARQQQEKLQFTSRLVTMGELASTLAHELNQPLAAIASYTAGCLNRLESGAFSPEELKNALGKLAIQAQRAGKIIRRVHDFVRKSEPKLAPCNLIEVIEDSVGLIESAARLANVRIIKEFSAECAQLMGDRVMLEQVLLNVIRNAIEAMSLGGTPSDRRYLTLQVAQPDEQQVQVRVVDRGPGIPAEVLENLFTPFFTTKPHGMGMGLNICRSIIELHRGRLWVEENPEGGTVIVISLPVILS